MEQPNFNAQGFESLMSDFTHVITILSGVEALHEEINFDGPLGDDVEYATTVLKLNDIDLPELAGQESFLDGLKRAGGKVKEFIKQLIAMIRDFFRPKEAAVKEAESNLRSLRKVAPGQEIVQEAVVFATTGVVPGSLKDSDKANAIRNKVRRLSTEEKSALKEASEQVTQNADIKDKMDLVEDNVRMRVNATINRFVQRIQVPFKEINRIDPTGESQSLLKIQHLDRISKMVDRLAGDSDNTSTDITGNISALCDIRGQLSAQKDIATRELDSLASRGDHEERVLNRATSVLQELVKAVESACNGVLSVDSAIRKTELELVDKITREIFRKAAKIVDADVPGSLGELDKIAGL